MNDISQEMQGKIMQFQQLQQQIQVIAQQKYQIEMQVTELEKTIEETLPEEYCDVKLDMMRQYNLTSVKCGTNSTVYWNAGKDGFEGYDTIAYRDCTEDWACIEWSPCVDGTQTRKCVDKNGCGSFYSKPEETQECAVTVEQTVDSTVISGLSTASGVQVSQAMELSLETLLPAIVVLFVAVEIVLLLAGIKSKRK